MSKNHQLGLIFKGGSDYPWDDRRYEAEFYKQKSGFANVAGLDEAGRGPLAGPVVAACVILDPNNLPWSVDDSKALKETEREALFEVITRTALSYGIGLATHHEVDTINILQATFLAMTRAKDNMTIPPDFLLIDGNQSPAGWQNCQTLVKGDSRSLSIAAASILAKVTRDRMMIDYHSQYPDYGFDRHKGYGTQYHIEQIKKHGYSHIHRRSFTIHA